MDTLKKLELLLASGKISRREFMRQASIIGAAAVVSPALLPKSARAQGPKKGGRLRIGCTGGSTTDSMDPGTLTSNWNQAINYQVRNGLVEINDKFEPTPELAESWEPDEGAVTWVYKIRKGVEFHNGKTLDAEDVVYSYQHHMKPDSKSAAKGLLDPVAEIKADGKDTVIFKLKGGNADFPFITSDYHLTIFPAGTEGAEFEKAIGTGGYAMDNWEPGVRSFTKRNPNYWKEGRAHFDEVETLSIPDGNARTNALKTGEIDYMDRCDLKTVHLLEKMPGIEIVSVTGTTHYTAPMRCDTAPYDNVDVRLALKYAVDREALVKQILRGYGIPGNDHPIAPNIRFFAENLEQRKYDPDKARFHLKKAGMEGETFKLSAADAAFGGAVDTAVLYKEHAAKAGINIEVVQEPNDGYWSAVWLKKAWGMCYWGGRPTVDFMFTTAYAADANWNDTFWKNDRFNELLVAARAELDTAKRTQMYAEMQGLIRDDGGAAVLMFPKNVEAASSKLAHGDAIAGEKEMDGMRISERWWFA